MNARVEPLWTCPSCGRRFAARRQVHTCRAPTDLERHFAGAEANVRETFDVFVEVARESGPFEVVPQATRIALHARMTFAALMPRRRWLNGHLVLARRCEEEVFHRVTSFSAGNHVHEFRLDSPEQIDADLRPWIAAAYDVGMQRHRGKG